MFISALDEKKLQGVDIFVTTREGAGSEQPENDKVQDVLDMFRKLIGENTGTAGAGGTGVKQKGWERGGSQTHRGFDITMYVSLQH